MLPGGSIGRLVSPGRSTGLPPNQGPRCSRIILIQCGSRPYEAPTPSPVLRRSPIARRQAALHPGCERLFAGRAKSPHRDSADGLRFLTSASRHKRRGMRRYGGALPTGFFSYEILMREAAFSSRFFMAFCPCSWCGPFIAPRPDWVVSCCFVPDRPRRSPACLIVSIAQPPLHRSSWPRSWCKRPPGSPR